MTKKERLELEHYRKCTELKNLLEHVTRGEGFLTEQPSWENGVCLSLIRNAVGEEVIQLRTFYYYDKTSYVTHEVESLI